MSVKIINRWTSAVMAEVDASSLGEAVVKLVAEARAKGERADLGGADLHALLAG